MSKCIAPYKFKDLDVGDEFTYEGQEFVKIKRKVKGGEPATAILRKQGKNKDINVYTYVPDSIKVELREDV